MPDSSKAKPACMRNTKALAVTSHTILVAPVKSAISSAKANEEKSNVESVRVIFAFFIRALSHLVVAH